MWETPPASAGDKLMAEPPPNLGGGSFCRESVRQSAHSLPGRRCLARASPSSSAVAQATLDLIESAADRVAILKGLFGAEVGKVPVSTRRVTELSAEIRQYEADVEVDSCVGSVYAAAAQVEATSVGGVLEVARWRGLSTAATRSGFGSICSRKRLHSARCTGEWRRSLGCVVAGGRRPGRR